KKKKKKKGKSYSARGRIARKPPSPGEFPVRRARGRGDGGFFNQKNKKKNSLLLFFRPLHIAGNKVGGHKGVRPIESNQILFLFSFSTRNQKKNKEIRQVGPGRSRGCVKRRHQLRGDVVAFLREK
ncbi:MAG: hypothetical protein BJ554DRAFT_6526, partial [Olpidium bornovanus]